MEPRNASVAVVGAGDHIGAAIARRFAAEAPWCMDQRCRRSAPCPLPRSRDADVLRASQVQHAVQHIGGDGHLGRLPPAPLRA